MSDWKEKLKNWCGMTGSYTPPQNQIPPKVQEIVKEEIKKRTSFEPDEKERQQVKDWNKRTSIKEVFRDGNHRISN